MRQFIFVACALLASAGLAWAGSPTNPDWVRQQQGTAPIIVDVSCATSDTALLTAVNTGDARSLTFVNEDGSNFVSLCIGAATCTANTGVALVADGQLGVSSSAEGSAWRCIADTGAVRVSVLIEK